MYTSSFCSFLSWVVLLVKRLVLMCCLLRTQPIFQLLNWYCANEWADSDKSVGIMSFLSTVVECHAKITQLTDNSCHSKGSAHMVYF